MFKKLISRLRSDRGNALVSAVIVFPLVVMFIVTGIDFSLYVSNRGQVQAVARDAARTVSIMGGNGTQSTGTPLEKAYGQTRASACNGLTSADGFKSTNTAIECNAIKSIKEHKGLVNININSVTCSPSVATAIGQTVKCSVDWKYNGIPASAFSFIGSNGSNITEGTSQSEVRLDSTDLVARG